MGLTLKRKLKGDIELPEVYARIGKIEYYGDVQVVYLYYYVNEESRLKNEGPELIRDFEFDTKSETRSSIYKKLEKLKI